MTRFPVFILLAAFAGLSPGIPGKSEFGKIITLPGGQEYRVFYAGKSEVGLSLKRPSQSDKNIILCIPAAFTRLDNGKPDGFIAENGSHNGSKSKTNGVGGACLICEKYTTLFPLEKGAPLPDSLVSVIEKNKCDFFQQIQIVNKGKVPGFKDKSLWQRRCFGSDKTGNMLVIEGLKPQTLAEFSADLPSFGVYNALYTDMGTYDEGWYRNEQGKIIPLGLVRTSTKYQSNWLFFRQKP
jgi:hypothetical protein